MDYEIRIRILVAMAASLEELDLSENWYLDHDSGKDYSFPDDIKFHKLREFTLALGVVNFEEDNFAGTLPA